MKEKRNILDASTGKYRIEEVEVEEIEEVEVPTNDEISMEEALNILVGGAE